MLLDRALNTLTLMGWILLAVFAMTFVFRVAMREGISIAIRKLFSQLFFVALFFVMALTALSESLVFVEPQEVGVVVSLISPGGYRDRPIRSGLHWIVPLMEQVYRYPIYWQTYTMSGKANEGPRKGDDSIVSRTRDGQEVALDCSIIFQVDAEQAIQVHIEWQSRYIEDYVRPLLRGVIRTQVSQFTVSEVNSNKRFDLEKELDTLLRESLKEQGFVMDRFLLRNITFSPEYAASVERKQVADQDIIQKQYQAKQIVELTNGEAQRIQLMAAAEAQATLVKARAESEALKLIADALARHPDLVTYRYVEKLSPAIRAMLVPSQAPYILPLPSMLEDLQATPTTTLTTTTALTPTTPLTPTFP